MRHQVDVIIPVCNEAGNLTRFYQRLISLPLDMRLIFIDNASTDTSRDIIRQFPGVTLIEHTANEGYGASILDGIKASSNDRIVVIDADGEFPPECVPQLLTELEHYDAVYASRLRNTGSPADAGMPPLRWHGNRFLTAMFNLVFQQQLTDLYTGCKAWRRNAVNHTVLQQRGFEHVLELAVQLAIRERKIGEIAIRFEPRQSGKSKMSHVTETLKFCWLLLRYRLCTKALR